LEAAAVRTHPKQWRLGVALAGLLAVPLAVGDATGALSMAENHQDAIVGSWVGQAAQPNQDPFEVRLTFVSPNGGVSRYPGDPACGGVLRGDRNGDHYEYQETIAYGGTGELVGIH
jgi:hypothetical protein